MAFAETIGCQLKIHERVVKSSGSKKRSSLRKEKVVVGRGCLRGPCSRWEKNGKNCGGMS